MEQQGLDDILNEAPAEPVTETPQTEAQPQAEAERPRDEHGRFLPKDTGEQQEAPQGAEPAEPSATPAPEPATVPRAALEDERRKRQAEASRAQYLEAQLQQFQRQQPAEQPAGFWDDPDARLEQFGESLIQRWEQRQIVNKANASEAAAKAKYEDYDEVIQEFHRAAAENPRLAAEMFTAPDPAEYAYRKAKSARDLAEVGSLEELEAKIRAKVEAEIRASAPSITAPQTTANQRSVGTRSGPVWTGPKALGELLPPLG